MRARQSSKLFLSYRGRSPLFLPFSLSHSLTPVQRSAEDLRDLDREAPRKRRPARHRRQHHRRVVVEPHVHVH